MNSMLLEPFTAEEISKALFQMHPDKATGMDGFSVLFYQKFWGHIKADVCSEVLNFLNGDCLDVSLNETQIILIPKKKEIRRV